MSSQPAADASGSRAAALVFIFKLAFGDFSSLRTHSRARYFDMGSSLQAVLQFFRTVAVLVNTATERDCPEQHPADTAGVRTDEHVKKQED